MKEITIAIEWFIQTIQRGLSVVCQPGNYSDKVFNLDSLVPASFQNSSFLKILMLDDSFFICYYDNQAGIIMSVSKKSNVHPPPLSVLNFHFS